LENPGENPFPGHDAIPHTLKNLTMFVAFLANLGHLQDHFSAAKDGTYRETGKIYPVYHQVFPKGSVLNLRPQGAEILDFFMGQETYLSVPITGMGVSFKSVLYHKRRGSHVFFGCPFFRAYTYR
jgi:hypothetical protein